MIKKLLLTFALLVLVGCGVSQPTSFKQEKLITEPHISRQEKPNEEESLRSKNLYVIENDS